MPSTKVIQTKTSIVFLQDETALCLLRRDSLPNTAQLGRFVTAVRRYDGVVRTSLHWLDPEKATLTEFMKLPSGKDTSYAGLVWHEDMLWVSYYSSHEGKTSINLAKVKFGN